MDSVCVLTRRLKRMGLRSIALLWLGLACLAAQAAADPFTRPAELADDIAFWRNVFASIDSNQAYLHDSRHLNIVYETVQIPAEASSRQRRRIADQRRDAYRKILTQLAAGQRTGLTSEQQRVLELWPADISNAELKEAARRIRFQQGLADRFQAGLVRAGAWQPYIKEQLRKHDVPLGLAALPHVESSFNPEARSHVGAAGLWQFTRPTGRRFMTIDHVMDERRDPFRSSESAAQLLAYNYSVLKSWPLAITAYNHGVGGMRRAVKQLGTDDIGVINRQYQGRTFGFASRNFYVAFLAAHDVQRDADKYFGKIEQNAPVPELRFKLPRYVPAQAVARAADISLSELKAANPALLQPVWDGTKHVPRNYRVRIPAAATPRTADDILAAIPRDQLFAAQTPDQYHKVRRGDSLSVIAARYGTTVNELVGLNGLKSRNRIRIGQVLRLPYAGAVIAPGTATYTVRSGDTLSQIAERAGVSQAELMRLNGLASRNTIYAGQKLRLGAAPAAAPAPTAAAQTPAAPARQAEAVASAEPAPNMAPSAADPANYDVRADGSIEILDGETLGHLADWLGVKTQRLRDLNSLAFGDPVAVGKRIKLDFAATQPEVFRARRIAWHRELQDAFFVNYKVTSTTEHRVKSGESLWLLTYKRYKVPVWLLRQYNPELDFGAVRAGTRIIFPRIEPVDRDA